MDVSLLISFGFWLPDKQRAQFSVDSKALLCWGLSAHARIAVEKETLVLFQ
jgi:hypothetical protein